MRRSIFLLVTIAPVACAVLGGCADLYMPRFDGGLENPDIRMLRVPEFMNGVKCGLVAFMHEREHKLLEDRRTDPRGMYRNIEAPPGSKIGKVPRVYSPYQLNMTANMRGCYEGQHAKCVRKGCSSPQDWQCVDNPCDAGLNSPEGDHRLGVALWDYSARKCVPIPDYNRFALDETQPAQVQLKMTAVNSGFVHFSKIDAVKSGLFPFVAIGGGASGNPFPVLNVDPKRTTAFDMTALMPQSVHTFNQAIGPAVFTGTRRAEKVLKDAIDQLRTVTNNFKNQHVFADADFGARAMSAESQAESPLQKEAGKLSADIEQLRKRAAALPTSYPNWMAKIEQHRLALTAERSRIEVIDGNARSSGETDAIKAQIETEGRRLRELADDFARDTADLRSAVEHDENISEWIAIVLANIADYIDNLRKAPDAESVSLAQQALAENSQRLVSRALEIRDKEAAADRLALVEREVSKLRKALAVARKIVEEEAAVYAAAKDASEKEAKANKAFTAPKQDQEFDVQCRPELWAYVIDQKTRIDFLGLKSLLDNLYEREDQIYRGIPDISLSQLVLTSEFDLALEVSAGMNYFRFIPILAAPGADFKKQHTHNLKVTLTGKKIKNSPGNNTGSKNLIASCEQRVSGGTAASDDFCASPPGQLLENILQAVSTPGASSAQ